MSHLKSPKLISKLFEPTRVFIALLIAAIIWLYPAIIGGSERQQDSTIGSLIAYPPPLQAFVLTDSAFATDSDSPGRDCGDCYQGCTEWDQYGCNEWGEICDECPPPPPVYYPPQITGTLNCSNWGNNGWCIGSLALYLSASDPQGQSIIISGNLNSTGFSCETYCSTLTVPIDTEGTGTIPYRVDSATGLNDIKSIDYQLDSSTPELNRTLSGVPGTDNWYRSNVTLNVTASDLITGIASITTTMDGGPQTEYAGPITISDGIHTVILTAADNAGNVTQYTETIQVDTITPTLSTTLSGTSGLNGWYVSTVSITPTASDSGSGLATLEASLDGGAWFVVSGPQSFSDGIHTYQFRATDNAGNVTESIQQTVRVDTTTPTINLAFTGKTGMNGWYVSTVTVTPVVNDATSGIALLEGTSDGGVWKTVNALTFSDGLHSYQFKVTDNAGNSTTVPVHNLKIDTIFPDIDMTETLSLGEAVEYNLVDYGSGLFNYRAVIEDDNEKYKKIVWVDDIRGNKVESQIVWDGKFADGAQAGWGEYFITLKIGDAAGNESMKTAAVTVNLFSFLKDIPTFIPPQTSGATQLDADAQAETSPSNTSTSLSAGFGGENNNDISGTEAITTNEGGASLQWPEDAIIESGFSIESANTSPFAPSNILWGAAATALLGATLADWQKKREEEARVRAMTRRERLAAEAGPLDVDDGNTYGRIAKAYQASLNAFKASLVSKGLSPTEANAYKTQAIVNGSISSVAGAAQDSVDNAKTNQRMENQMAKIDALDEAKWTASQAVIAQREKEKIKAEEQTGLQAYYEGRKAGEVTTNVPKKDETWLENVWNKAFNNQVELSLGTGIVVGVAAVVAVVAGVITAPAWLVVGGAVLVTAAIITAGTVALNTHFGLGLGNNLAINLAIGTVAAFLTTGAGLLLAGAAPLIGTTIVKTCEQYTTVCTQIGTIIDKGEEALLAGQLAYYTWTGNQDNAAQTAIELQLEQMDGNVPGNSVANELSEQIAKLGPDAAELIAKQGNDVIPLLLKYGDDAVDIIGAYGDEGTTLLTMYGDDAAQLIKEYGTPAVDLVISHGDDAIRVYQSGSPAVGPLTDFIPEDYYDDVLNAFENNPNAITLNDDLTVYRYWSGDDRREVGSWVTLNSNLTPDEARKLLALPDSNLAVNVTQFTIPAQTTILLGEAAEQTSSSWAGAYAAGGGLQIYLSNPSVLVKNQ